jgi:hypothetical protein
MHNTLFGNESGRRATDYINKKKAQTGQTTTLEEFTT